VAFADDLRALGSDELAILLTARPELADPAPSGVIELANRASAPYSIQRCIGTLNIFSEQVLHALALFGAPVGAEQIANLASNMPPVQLITDELYRLRTLGLVIVRLEQWTLSPVVNRILGRPFGLGQPLEQCFDRHGPSELRVIAENLGLTPVIGKVGLIRQITDVLKNPALLHELIDRLPARTRTLLSDSIADGLSTVYVPGLMNRSRVAVEAAQLLSCGLIVPVDWDAAEIPREVALILLGGKPIEAFATTPPPIYGTETPASGQFAVDDDRESDGNASVLLELSPEHDPATVVDLVNRVLYRWAEEEPPLLKNGGVGVATLKLQSKELGLSVPLLARVVALAGMAGLVATDHLRERAMVTDAGRVWLTEAGPDQWTQLIHAWRSSLHDVFPVASTERAVTPLGGGGLFVDAPWRRGRLLHALVSSTYKGVPDPASVQRHVVWEGPNRWSGGDITPRVAVFGLLDDLRFVGLLRGGRPTVAAAALVNGDSVALRSAVQSGFPEPTDTFTLQADLTALAPGELRAEIAAELNVIADVESRGGATLFRFSEASIRRAMDRGRTAESLKAFVARHGRPTVPQTLDVLITDVARRHGQLRIGRAQSYLRADDPALLATAVNHRKLAKARLVVIAPSVAISELEPAKLLKQLRDAGFAPMPDGNGVLELDGPPPKRMPPLVAPYVERARQDAERAWLAGLAGNDPHRLMPSVPVKKLADRLRAGKH
jgi:hypothetical protein